MKKILALLLFFTVPVFAQQKLTITDCYKIAEKNNINIRQLTLSKSLNEIDLKQSKNNLLPNMNANTNYSFNLGRSLDPTSYSLVSQSINTVSVGLNAGVDLFNGFTRWNTIKSNEINVDVADLDKQAYQNTLNLSIFSAYLEILKAQEQLSVLNQQIKITNDQFTRTDKLIKAGLLAKGDIIDIEAQQAQNEVQKVNAQNLIQLSKLNLQQLMNYYEDFEIETPALPQSLTSNEILVQKPDEIFKQALSYRPEIKANNLRMNIADYQLKIAKGSKYPTLRFFTGANTNFASIEVPGNFQLVDIEETLVLNGQPFTLTTQQEIPTTFEVSPFFNQLNDNLSWNFGLSLNIPIFNQFVVKNNIERAKLNIENQQLSNQSTENELFQIIQQAYLTAKSNQATYQANITNIESLQRSYDNINKKYELGAATALELNTAQNNLTIAKLNMNNAKFDYIFSLKILEFYLGKPLLIE